MVVIGCVVESTVVRRPAGTRTTPARIQPAEGPRRSAARSRPTGPPGGRHRAATRNPPGARAVPHRPPDAGPATRTRIAGAAVTHPTPQAKWSRCPACPPPPRGNGGRPPTARRRVHPAGVTAGRPGARRPARTGADRRHRQYELPAQHRVDLDPALAAVARLERHEDRPTITWGG